MSPFAVRNLRTNFTGIVSRKVAGGTFVRISTILNTIRALMSGLKTSKQLLY